MRAFPAEHRGQQAHWQRPQQGTDDHQPGEPEGAEPDVVRGRGVIVDQCRTEGLVLVIVAAQAEFFRYPATAQVTDDGGTQHDQREGHVEGEYRGERRRGDRPQPIVLECAGADPVGGMHHDCRYRWLDAVENARHYRHFAKGDVQPGQRDENEQRRQHEQCPGDDPAPTAVHQPAQVRGQLLGLWPRQQHAVIKGMQESSFGNPASALHQLLVHDRDLPRRAAEADEAQFEPEPEGHAQADGVGSGQGRSSSVPGRFAHGRRGT